MSRTNLTQKEKKHNYFYKTTNLINGKYYYGIRSTDKRPETDNYFGSGKALKHAIQKYGKENFKKEIIADYLTRKEASDHEKQVVTFEMINLAECYNCRTGGDNGFTFKHTDNWKSDMSIRMSGNKNPFYGKNHSNEAREKLSGEKNGMFGKTHTEEARKRIGAAQLGEKNCNFGKNLSEAAKEKLRNQSYCKPCSIMGVTYISVKAAVRQLELPENTVRNRLNSKTIKFSDWNFI